MPRYKKKFKEASVDQLVTLLSQLNADQLKSLQSIAKHFQGQDQGFGKHVPKQPYKKVLPEAWDDILAAEHGTQLAGGVLAEHYEHLRNPSYHRGGGLFDGLSSLFHVGWNYLTSAIAPLGWIQEKWDNIWNYRGPDKIPETIKRQVDGIHQASLSPDERKDIHGWALDKSASSDRVAVYVSEKNKEVHAIIRGTDKTAFADIKNDVGLLFTGKVSLHGVRETLVNVSRKYGNDYDMSCVGYSLGGSMLTQIFTGDENRAELDKYDDLILVNPGGSTFAGEGSIKKIIADDRTTLLVNRSDLISAIYTQQSDPKKTYYGKHSWGPLESHADEQFGTNPDEEWRDEEASKPWMSTQDVAMAVGLD